jgi:YhcN/YlaJ family sporulation lipoprotein
MASLHKWILTAGAFSMLGLAGCNTDNAADDQTAVNDNMRNVTHVNDRQNVVNDNNRYMGDDDGRYGVDGSLRNVRNVGDGGEGINNPLRNNGDVDGLINRNDEPLMSKADEAADKVAGLQGVERATVIVTDRNAYVAAELEGNQNAVLNRRMENEIAKAVRQTDANIQNVYVSTNPDFMGRMDQYANNIGEGRPAAGLFEEFNEAVRRVFPNAR